MQIALLCAVALGLVSADTLKVTPVQKVIQLLEGMVEKGTKEKQDEEIQFTKFKGFCESTTKFKRQAIEDGTDTISSLEADIQKFEADAELLAKEIAQIDIDLTTWKGDQKASQKVRDIERAEYEKTHKEYTEAIDALDEAIATLMKQAGDVAQEGGEEGGEAPAAEALMQVSNSNLIPAHAKKAIAAFMQIQPQASVSDAMAFGALASKAHDQLDAEHEAKLALIQTSDAEGAPEANAYEFQAQGVVDMMQKLVDRFTKERSELEDTEMAARRAFQMVQGDLKNQISGSEGVNEEKKIAKAKSLQSKASAEGDLADAQGTLAEDEKYLADLIATCEQKAVSYESRQKLRAEELEAVNKAIEIMSGGAVSGASEKHLPSLAQQATALVQLRNGAQSPSQVKVVAFLKNQAGKLNSRLLSVLATKVANDPFKKVKKMIKDLIVKLMEEANDEAEHKGFCDMEMATNKNTRDKKSEDVINLTAQIDELKASIAKIAQDIEGLSAEIAELDAAVAKATTERDEEKAKNTVIIKDAQGAQAAVKQALAVLNEFYEKAGEATALVQEHQEPPATFDEPYKGMGGESGGVVGMMEVIQADFARLESETTTAEGEAAKEYNEFMDDSRLSKTNKSADLDHKQEKKADQSTALASAETELAGTQKELDSANAYFDKLKPQCMAPEVSFEDRQARRKEEIESLQMALQILQGEDVVF
jgi:hypothetical protein